MEAAIVDIPKESIAYVDETEIDDCPYPEYGRAKRGEKVFGKVSGRCFKRTGFIAAKMGKPLTTVAVSRYYGQCAV